MDLIWNNKKITSAEILSKSGNDCKIKVAGKYKVTRDEKNIPTQLNTDGTIDFKTVKGRVYKFSQL